MYQRLLLVLMLSVITAVNTMAQDQPVSRRVTVKEVTQGIHVIINEINSENYPKVRIFTTVLKDGKPLKGLGVEDFKVNEDEVAQEPLTVEPKLPPLSVVLMLDTSGSMFKRMKQTQDAAMSFLDTLSGNDSVQVVTFARKVRPVTTMSADRKAAREAISSTLARGDTALYSALYQSVQLLKNRIGRKAVVVLSDGVDDDGTGKPLSKQTLKDVISLAREVNVPIYVLALGTEIDKAGLMAVADETGALYFEAPQASELKALYEEIGAQLAGQYSISYSSSLPADSTERRVTMTAQNCTSVKIYKAPGTLHTFNQSGNSQNSVETKTIKVFSNVPEQSSNNFKTKTRADLHIQTTKWDQVPYHVAPPFSQLLSLAPGQLVTISGDKTGNAGFSIDNFLLIEVSEADKTTRFLLGTSEPVTCAGKVIKQMAKGFNFTSPGFDLTPYLPKGVSFKLDISALDYGAVGYVSDLYLIITSGR